MNTAATNEFAMMKAREKRVKGGASLQNGEMKPATAIVSKAKKRTHLKFPHLGLARTNEP
jgi:hypothetical protein